MKKIYIIGIVVVCIIIAIATGIVYHMVVENEKKYEVAQVKQYNYFVLKENNLNGVIDKKGNTIIPANYDDIKIPNPEKAVFVCYQGDTVKVLNETKQEILTEYQKVEPIRLKNIASNLMYEKTVLTYLENGKYGLIDFSGKKLTKAIYDEITGLPYKEGELLVKKDEQYGVINIKGKELIKTVYEKITVDGYYTDINQYSYSGYIVSVKTEEGYRYGYIDCEGKMILKPEYNELSRITEIEDNQNVYMIGAKNGQYGVTKNEKDLVNNEYQSIRYDSVNNVLVVEKSKKYGIVNLDGKLIVPVEYNQIDITGVYLYAQNEQGTTVYNSNGTQANIDTNVAILNTSNEKYRIRINNENGTKYGVIGKEGQQIIEEKYNYLEYLFENYFIVSNEKSKLGIIDDKENQKLEVKYDSVQKIQDTDLIQATITESNITQIFDKQMKSICEMQDAKLEKTGEYIKIYNEQETRYFDKDGKELKNTQVYSTNKLFAKEENGKWGFVDNNGQKVVEYTYDKVTEFNDYGFAAVKKDGKWGSINEQGQVVQEPIYELNEDTEPFFIGIYYQIKYGFGEVYFTNSNS